MRVRGSDAEANWSNVAKGAAIVALLSSAQMPAEVMEIVGGLNRAVHQRHWRLLQRPLPEMYFAVNWLRLLLCCDLPRKVVFGETNQPNGERYRGQH